MDKFEFAQCVSQIDEKFIEEAQPPEDNQINIRRHKMPWALIAACLFLVIALPILVLNLKSNETPTQTAPIEENIVPTQTQLTFSVYQNGSAEGETQQVSGHTFGTIESQTPDPALPTDESYTNYNWIYSRDGSRRYSSFDTSQFCCYENETLLWKSEVLPYSISKLSVLENSIVVIGCHDYYNDTGRQNDYYIQLFDLNGQPRWEKTLLPNHTDYAAALEHENGDFSIFFMADGYTQRSLYYNRFSANGELLDECAAGAINAQCVLDVAETDDGFVVLLGSGNENYIFTSYVAFLNEDGTLHDYWEYQNSIDNMRFTNVLQSGNKCYLSGYLVHDRKTPHSGGEIGTLAAETLIFIEVPEGEFIHEVTEHVRAYYTAILLEIDVASGKIVTFYTTDGAMGEDLYLEEDGSLCWQHENIGSTYCNAPILQYIRGASERINYRLKDDNFTVEKTQIYTDFTRSWY